MGTEHAIIFFQMIESFLQPMHLTVTNRYSHQPSIRDDSDHLASLELQSNDSFALHAEDCTENILASSKAKLLRRGDKVRNPFQNLSNCDTERASPQKQRILSFSKKGSHTMQKYVWKENRISQETRASEAESIVNLATEMEEKSTNLQLAEQLEEKARLLNQRITKKIDQIKSQFWDKRAHSLLAKPTLASAHLPKPSLLAHLKRKHSAEDSPTAVKECYMKFIPMREVGWECGRAVPNRRAAQVRLAQRVGLQFKCGR